MLTYCCDEVYVQLLLSQVKYWRRFLSQNNIISYVLKMLLLPAVLFTIALLCLSVDADYYLVKNQTCSELNQGSEFFFDSFLLKCPDYRWVEGWVMEWVYLPCDVRLLILCNC